MMMMIMMMTEVSFFSDISPQQPDMLVSSWQGFTIVMAEIRLLHSSCCIIGDLPSAVSLAPKK
jgi:hypothetical protein